MGIDRIEAEVPENDRGHHVTRLASGYSPTRTSDPTPSAQHSSGNCSRISNPMVSSPARRIAACHICSAPDARGRLAVRATFRSRSRSHISLTTQPAPRMTMLPMANNATSHAVRPAGAPPSSNPHRPGKNNNQAPIGLSSRSKSA
jgi:hypothetical protein